jgi:hypothetical protein
MDYLQEFTFGKIRPPHTGENKKKIKKEETFGKFK